MFSLLASLVLPVAIAAAVYAGILLFRATPKDGYYDIDSVMFGYLGLATTVPIWFLATAEQVLTWRSLAFKSRVIVSTGLVLAAIASVMVTLAINRVIFDLSRGSGLLAANILAIVYLALGIVWVPAQLMVSYKAFRVMVSWILPEQEDRLETGGTSGGTDAELHVKVAQQL